MPKLTLVRVITLDPQSFFCIGLEICLVKAGYEVLLRVHNYSELLKGLDSNIPDLAAVGPNFAEPEAFTVCRVMVNRWPDIRIVFYTGHAADPLVQVDAYHSGIKAVLPRQAGEAETIATIQAVLTGQLVFAEEILKCRRTTLTQRELDVVKLIAEGKTDKDIATSLELSVATIRNHSQRILEKLGVHVRHDAVRRARRLGWIG